MDALIAKGGEILLNHGLPGLIILYLLYERRLFMEQLKALGENINKIQESRIAEAREVVSAVDTIADTVELFKETMKGNNRWDRRGGEG